MDIEDLAGLGKLADSELVNKVYDDAGASAAKELGQLALDLTKTLRLFTAPFQVAAMYQDRLDTWLDEARRRVPPERQIEAVASIAGPALRGLLFMEEENPLAAMFVNLLGRAIDRDGIGDVHPGFSHILEQISPDEALLLCKLGEVGVGGIGISATTNEEGTITFNGYPTTFPQEDIVYPRNLLMYIEHLESLGLVGGAEMRVEANSPDVELPDVDSFKWYMLSAFGARFLSVCAPDKPNSIRMDNAWPKP